MNYLISIPLIAIGIYLSLQLVRIIWHATHHTVIGCPVCQTVSILATYLFVAHKMGNDKAPEYVLAMLLGMIAYFSATHISNVYKKHKYKDNPEMKNESPIKVYFVFAFFIITISLWKLLM
jgi:hypothetical protein